MTATLHPGAGTALEFPAIRAALPQRYPLLLVDRVLDLRPGARIETVKLVSATDPCYAGVPEQPGGPAAYRYPASLLIESFGQSAALLWLHGTGTGAGTDDAVLLFVAAREYEVHGHAYPGDTVRHVVELERVIADTAFATGGSWVGDRCIATVGSLTAARRPRAALDPAAVPPPG